MPKKRRRTLPDGRIYESTISDAAVEVERAARERWRRENYDRIAVDVPKGMRDELKAVAEAHGRPLRQFLIELFENAIEQQKSSAP